ncbi:MAG TPA: thioesterase family protein [Thermoanaerobaculia bacterium]|nr:thioesterase family protein [Thermoanaerobaculia bacterium]
MKETLRPGLTGSMTQTVTADMAARHLPRKVLSTPSMIGLVEWACLSTIQPHLDEGETSVGTHVDVSHTGPAFPDEEVRIDVRVKEIRKRRIELEIEVHSPRGPISTGRHERAVVDASRYRD